MILQWILVGVIIGICLFAVARTLFRKDRNACSSCAVKDCCKKYKKK